ncbi:MAG: hypothetical protein HC765_00115 [Brachymonas sp.]|nr:hypothetical protein [Brachymonas sp.]
MKFSHLMLALSASVVLAACGSGNNTTESPPNVVPGVALVPGTDVPISATQSSAAAIDFVSQVVALGEANTQDPLVLGDALLAFSDIDDPVSIIAA